MSKNKWTLPVEKFGDEFLLTFPPDLMSRFPDWQPGVSLIWTKQPDQSWVVSLDSDQDIEDEI